MESMLRFFTSSYNQASDEAQWYIRQKLQLRLESIYHYMLIVNRSNENNIQLKAFDNQVKTISPEAFQMMDDVKDRVTGFRYIHSWRTKGYNAHIPT
jgi:hypothetical protein